MRLLPFLCRRLPILGLEHFESDVLPEGGAGVVASSGLFPSPTSDLGEVSID